MHRALRTVAPLSLVVAALLGAPPPLAATTGVAAPVTATTPTADLALLRTELDRVVARATALADELEAEAARASGLRAQIDRLAEEQDAARARVGARARQAYLALQGRQADPMARLVGGLAAPDLRGLADAELARRGTAAAVRAQSALSDAVGVHADAAAELERQTAAYRAGLAERAAQALAAQEQARALLVQAEAAVAAEQVRAQQRSVAAQTGVLTAGLAATRSRLDGASAVVTKALTPAQTRRSLDAAARQAPVVALVEAAGAGYPRGYAPTGQVLRGEASWYGPGFVGNPTASGAPYDPERLTCAHKTLPLGTVVRVARGPLALSCLVNDRGPYVGDRILDLSRAGSRALGFDGVAQVVVEVLAPVS